MAIQKIKESYCATHRRMLPIEEFYKSPNPLHGNHVLLYCKDCCIEIMQKNLRRFGNVEKALWYTCAELGFPFRSAVYERLNEKMKTYSGKRINYLGEYIRLFHAVMSKTDKWESFNDTDVSMGEFSAMQDAAYKREEEIRELKMLWGDSFSVDDISYLEYRFTIYTEGMELTEYQASRYRDLCLCELKIKNMEEVKTNMALKANIAKELGIDKFTRDSDKTEAEKYLENDIYMMEQYEPAEYYADKELYKDFVGIYKYWTKWVLRPIKNLIIGSKDYEISEDSKFGDDDDTDTNTGTNE